MCRRVLPFGIALVALAFIAGCQRLESARPFEFHPSSEMTFERLPSRDAIPASFGTLIGVTSNANFPVWTQAWFVRPDNSIAIVWINARNGALVDRAVIIPRR